MFAAPEDEGPLFEFAGTIGLRFLPPNPGEMSSAELQRFAENRGGFGYFSFLPLEQLHLYGPSWKRVSICDATDPLIFYSPPSYTPPNLIAGHILWNGQDSKFGAQTRLYYAKLLRWVEKHWRKRIEDGYFIGPEADKLAEMEETQLYYLPPGVKIEKVVVPDVKRITRDKKHQK
jgi:hypothetical protein